MLARFTAGRAGGRLLDIGCGAGLFLHRQQDGFARVQGIEISPPSVDYARRVLGLEIVDGIAAVDGPVDVATAWHSLEHMPAAVLTDLLAGLRAKLAPGGCVIVSVPKRAADDVVASTLVVLADEAVLLADGLTFTVEPSTTVVDDDVAGVVVVGHRLEVTDAAAVVNEDTKSDTSSLPTRSAMPGAPPGR